MKLMVCTDRDARALESIVDEVLRLLSDTNGDGSVDGFNDDK